MKLIDYSDVEIRSLWNDYADTRNKVLKKTANNKLKNLIEFVNSKSNEDKKAFVDYLCNEKFKKRNIEGFQHPLVENLILPVIAPMVENDQMPYLRWSYELNRACYNSEEILLKANKVDPSDIKTVTLLIDMYMNELWYGSHHLPEFILINEKEANECLSRVSDIVKKYEDKINPQELYEDINYYRDLYDSWFAYKNENSYFTFEQWCERNNKKFSWISAYYYE